jgi:hypothetical protein
MGVLPGNGSKRRKEKLGMTIIAEVGSGRRTCNARCYNGKKETHCKCICGGANHAVGLEKALDNARRLFGMSEESLAVVKGMAGIGAKEVA